MDNDMLEAWEDILEYMDEFLEMLDNGEITVRFD